jgi:5'(3')-deoxyribonucleotidase
MKKIIPKIDFNPFAGFFLDLDGVFADLHRRIHHLTGLQPHQMERKHFWKVVMSDKKFFASLEMMPDAEHLWTYTKQYGPKFLTGAPPGEQFRQQKRDWTAKMFGPEHETIVLPAKDKQLHSGPGIVLIDDTPRNIAQWTEKGGHGFLHTDVWETIEAVEELRKGYKV